MAAGGRGLTRALHSSPCPAWKRAQSGASGRLKPEYDAVVIGAGKAKEGRARAQGRKAASCPRALEGPPGRPRCCLSCGHDLARSSSEQDLGWKSSLVWESGSLGSDSTLVYCVD